MLLSLTNLLAGSGFNSWMEWRGYLKNLCSPQGEDSTTWELREILSRLQVQPSTGQEELATILYAQSTADVLTSCHLLYHKYSRWQYI